MRKLFAASILTIVDACMCVFVGFMSLLIAASYTLAFFSGGGYFLDFTSYAWFLIGIFGILAFGFGLKSGMMMLRRKQFAWSIIGVCFILVSGFVILLWSFSTMGWILGVPFYGLNLVFQLWFWFGIQITIIVFAILSLILVATSKREFS